MVEYDNVLIQDVKHIGRIVLFLCLVLHGDILEIAHCIERGVAVESAAVCMFARYTDVVDECMDRFVGTIVLIDLMSFGAAVGKTDGGLAMADGDRGDRIDADE